MVMLLGRFLNRYMKPLFNIRGEGAFAFVMGMISGYPVGAKIASSFRQNNICSKEECERLLAFTNNSGPLFIIGTVGILMFKNTTIGILLFITHILACLTVGFLFRYWKRNKKNSSTSLKNSGFNQTKQTVTFSNLGEILAQAITSSISTILLIGGFMVIFSSIISILKASRIITKFYFVFNPFF